MKRKLNLLFTVCILGSTFLNFNHSSAIYFSDSEKTTSTIEKEAPAPTVAMPFTDIKDHKYETAIDYVREKGIVEGYSDGKYKPDIPINRAEFTKIMIESSNSYPTFEEYNNCFPDVKTEWYAPYICYSKEWNIISGYPNGFFKPANNINLAESLKIIFETAEINLANIPDEPWYTKYMNLADLMGFLSKIDPNPSHLLTRGEMAELIYKISLMDQ